MPTPSNTCLIFFVNGKRVLDENPDPECTLLHYLRVKLRLTGSKLGCAEGGCGACTVMVSKFDRTTRHIDHIAVNACLAPVVSMHGVAVTTVEGIGSIKTRLHPVQERIAKSFGSQCGFCTPGIVMSMYTLLRNNPQPTRSELESAFEGNLCRCTGYRPILAGYETFTKEYQCRMGDQCCRKQSTSTDCGIMVEGLFSATEFVPYDSTQEPIFPSELQLTADYDESSLEFRSPRVTWYRPVKLEELLELKHRYPEARLVVGNTEVGIETKFKGMHYPVMIAPTHIAELKFVNHTERGVTFGAAVTLATMEHVLRGLIKEKPAHSTRVFAAIIEMLRWFAGHQVRNVAAIAGNIVTASPISDLNHIFLSAGCVLIVASQEGGERTIFMDHTFFKGYRKTALAPEEIVVSITIPYIQKREYFLAFKQAHRRNDDIAIVNAAFRVLFDEDAPTVRQVALSFGGMAPITVMATKTMEAILGRRWEDGLLDTVCEKLGSELALEPGVPGGMASYRCSLTTSLFFKFYLSVLLDLQKQNSVEIRVPENMESVTKPYSRPPSKGIQLYEGPEANQSDIDPVGRPLVTVSALKQATGEAQYVDDMPVIEGELYLAFVQSTVANGDILSVDWSEALTMPGVVDKVDHTDVPATNKTGQSVKDEEVFASKQVHHQGQAIGAIVARTQVEAQRAAKKVKVTYEKRPPIITIKDAIAAKSFLSDKPSILVKGNPTEALAGAAHVVEGEWYMGGQEHFYMETQACAVRPGEDGEMEVFCSSQCLHFLQESISWALGVPCHKIVGRVKRMGGGFGGKETRFSLLAVPVAVAANKLGLPVRAMLDRDEDMILTGNRHPFHAKYKAGCDEAGKLVAVEAEIYSNCGFSIDRSDAVMQRCMFTCFNAYTVPHCRLTGYLCRTNLPSNTAFRGFGGPQGVMIGEAVMDQLAAKMGRLPEELRELNLVREGELTHYNMKVENATVRRCWQQVLDQARFTQRREEIVKFNEMERYKKRGIASIPIQYGISFVATFLNQAGALVHIYTDGSVLLSLTGTEMGQGLYTKMIQVASRALDIPAELIHISESNTSVVPNASSTAASSSSDLNGMAVLNACEILKERLRPYKEKNPDDRWEDWVSAAYFDRTGLSATGFYKTPNLGYDCSKNEGRPFSYFSMGAAVSEVEIDCLTGDHTVLRTDIVMDVGKSLNPAIDIGQIEGAFVQGYGLLTIEQHRYSPDGTLYTRGPGMYKLPGFGDIPIDLNVTLLKEAPNTKAVYSSKAIGEPPLCLAGSIFFAVKNAIAAARKDSGLTDYFRLDSPATCDRIRMACEDRFTKQFPEAEPGSYKPWYVEF